MKNIAIALLLAGSCFVAKAQIAAVKYPALDASPMDAAYFPVNVTKAKDASTPIIKIVYSRPQRKGREVFGVLEQFDKVWRLGANENTEVTFFKNVTIGDKKVKKGTYALFAVPSAGKWVIIVNKQTDKWGAFSYDSGKDVVRVEVPVSKLEKPLEALSMTFAEVNGGANLYIAWDATQVIVPIKF